MKKENPNIIKSEKEEPSKKKKKCKKEKKRVTVAEEVALNYGGDLRPERRQEGAGRSLVLVINIKIQKCQKRNKTNKNINILDGSHILTCLISMLVKISPFFKRNEVLQYYSFSEKVSK